MPRYRERPPMHRPAPEESSDPFEGRVREMWIKANDVLSEAKLCNAEDTLGRFLEFVEWYDEEVVASSELTDEDRGRLRAMHERVVEEIVESAGELLHKCIVTPMSEHWIT